MTRTTLIRVLLAAVLAVSSIVRAAQAQVIHRSNPPDPPLGQVSLPPQQPFDLPPSRGPAPKSGPVTTQLRNGFNLPLPGAPHVLDEVILDIPASVSEAR